MRRFSKVGGIYNPLDDMLASQYQSIPAPRRRIDKWSTLTRSTSSEPCNQPGAAGSTSHESAVDNAFRHACFWRATRAHEFDALCNHHIIIITIITLVVYCCNSFVHYNPCKSNNAKRLYHANAVKLMLSIVIVYVLIRQRFSKNDGLFWNMKILNCIFRALKYALPIA